MPTPSASERALATLTDAVDPASVARFRTDLGAAAGRAIDPAEILALAVSGGPDSMAMLALVVKAYPGQVVAATYDHRVRPGSAAEADEVGQACRAFRVAHAVLTPTSPSEAFRHASARADRYAALEGWAGEAGANLLLTAHHADDQAETLLMRLNRGSGIAGLAGIRARRSTTSPFVSSEVEKRTPTPTFLDCARNRREGEQQGGLKIIRPLLGWRRAELRALAEASGLGFVDDPSNADPRFERAGVRAFLAGQDWLDPARLARSAAYLGEAEADLRAITDWLWADRRVAADAGAVVLALGGLPRELQRRLLRRALTAVATTPVDPAVNVEPLLDALANGRAATQAGVLVRPDGETWRFAPAPPRRTP